MTLAEKFEKIGIEKKHTEMIENGIKRTALKLLGKTMDIQSINDIKELSIESISKLKSKLQFNNDEPFNKP